MDDIKVSVCMITYNHERFIAQAVESVLAQQTTFPIELVIGDDYSTDNTRTILQRLAEQNPDKVHLQLAARNRGPSANFVSVFDCCRGQYVAMLEGDDYWNCPNKLQMQVEALDAHPEWAICFHPAECLYEDGLTGVPVYPYQWTKAVAKIEDLFAANFMATSSVVFRNRLFDEFPIWFHRLTVGDWPLHILNAAHGNIGYLPDVMSTYRIHRGGAWSGAALRTQLITVSEMLGSVDHHFAGKYADLVNRYRTATIDHLLHSLDATRNQLATIEEQLRHAQAVADAQVQTYAEIQARESVRSGYLESDLNALKNEQERLSTEIAQLQMEHSTLLAKYAALTTENCQLKRFHDNWSNWMFYPVVREMRRPFRQASRWWKQRRAPGASPLPTSDDSERKAA